jgi:NAD(P)-dependent dehydrogenase (short-subunit alcohol dehydrogenase family)
MKTTAVVTGAGRGLAYYLTEQLVKKGVEVYAIVRTMRDAIERLDKQYDNLILLRGDVGETEKIKPALDRILKSVDRLDYVYNVAAMFYEPGDRKTIKDTNIDAMPYMFSVNACGALRVIQGLLPVIGKGTRIINVSSEAASITRCPEIGLYSYCMSKAALNIATKILNNDLGREGIRSITVCPGWMRTDMGSPQADMDPKDSAADIIKLAEHMDELPGNEHFFKHLGHILPW